MDKKDLTKIFLAGAFFVGGLILIFFFILTLGKDKGFAKSKFEITAIFHNVGGLSEGAPVRLSGVNIGNVAEVGFLDRRVEGRLVKVNLHIFEKFRQQLDNGLIIKIKTEGVLGEKLVEVYVVEDIVKTDLTKPIVGIDPLDISDLADVFTNAADSFTKTATEMSQIDILELTDVMLSSSKALLKTSEGINEIMFELQDIAIKSKRIFDRIEQKIIDDDLFKVF